MIKHGSDTLPGYHEDPKVSPWPGDALRRHIPGAKGAQEIWLGYGAREISIEFVIRSLATVADAWALLKQFEDKIGTNDTLEFRDSSGNTLISDWKNCTFDGFEKTFGPKYSAGHLWFLRGVFRFTQLAPEAV